MSHFPDEVARLADHIVVLDAGRVVADGPLTDILARIDLPIHLGEDAGVVLDAKVVERDAQWNLARLEFQGGSLWVSDAGHSLSHRLRVRILARDVSLSQERIDGSSILNILPATVVEIAADEHPALCMIRMEVGTSPLVARLTRRSAVTLGLAPGSSVWAQIKAVALIG